MKKIYWKYNNKEVKTVKDMPENVYGFVYCVFFADGSKYIGKKQIFNTRRLKALQGGKQRPDSKRIGKNKNGKRVYYDVVVKESNWQAYQGSKKEIQDLEVKEKHILDYAYSNRELTYLETKYLFLYEVLESDEFHNSNILGKFYKNNIK